MNRLILSTLNRFMGQTVNKGVEAALKKVSDKAQTAIETTPMDTRHPPGTSETVKMARHRHLRTALGQIIGVGQIDQHLIFLIKDPRHIQRFEDE